MITEDKFDLVSGYKQKRYDPLSKTLPTKLFNATARKISGVHNLHDFNCGLKAYRRDVVKNIEVYGEMHRYIPYLANLDQSWVNVNVDALMERYLGRAVVALNDADAAGIAKVAYGAAKGRDGVIVFTTQGTGIGSAIIVNGTLLTNTELGHLEIDGTDAEKNASSGQKTLQGLSWEQWAQRLQRYYSHVEFLLNPDLFVVGGGVSENHEKFMPLLKLKTPMIPAKLLNTAGIVGAAYYAAQHA